MNPSPRNDSVPCEPGELQHELDELSEKIARLQRRLAEAETRASGGPGSAGPEGAAPGEAKVDVRKLQLLNDLLTQRIETLNQLRLSLHGPPACRHRGALRPTRSAGPG